MASFPYSAPETFEISDASRIRKAGFDLRTTFRKPRESPRPRPRPPPPTAPDPPRRPG